MSAKANSAATNRIDTLIGAGMHVAGDVVCAGTVRVQGSVAGSVSCDGGAEGTLVVDGAGSVSGPARAGHVAVRGRIDGPVRAAQALEVFDGGSVTGEVSFAELAIHLGGVVDGTLIPLARPTDGAQLEPRSVRPQPTPSAVTNPSGGPGRKVLIAVVALALIASATWLARSGSDKRKAADDVALRSSGSLEDGKLQRANPPAGDASWSAPDAATAPPATRPETASTAPADSRPRPERSAAPAAQVATVEGANASRPANVFLLVTSEPTLIFRKKRDDPGEGARIAVPQGERVSVGVGADELIRVAKGVNAVIFYQGKKVPAELVESGTWIGFVPR